MSTFWQVVYGIVLAPLVFMFALMWFAMVSQLFGWRWWESNTGTRSDET